MLSNVGLAALFFSLLFALGLPLSVLLGVRLFGRPSYLMLTLAAVLGMALLIVLAANTLALGISWRTTPVFAFLVWLSAALMAFARQWRLTRTLVPLAVLTWGAKRFGLLLALVCAAAVLLSLSKPDNALLGMRLGIDAALYGDTAQLLLEQDSTSGLADLAASSPTSFGPAALMVHLRWGAPLLLALFTWLAHLTHSYEAALPVLAVCLGLSAAATIALARRVGFNKPLALLCGALVITNYPIIHLSLEGQWPQAIALPIFLSIVLLWAAVARLPGRPPTASLLGIALLLSASALVYSEYLPVLFALLVTACVLEAVRRQWRAAKYRLLTLCLALVLAAILVLPYILRLVPHLLGLTTEGVGYPTPLMLYPSEVVGLGSIWTRWEEWITPNSMPVELFRENWIRDAMLAIAVTCLFAMGTWRITRTTREWPIWVASFIVVSLMGLGFAVSLHTGYLWSKGVVTFAPIILVCVLFAIAPRSRAGLTPQVLSVALVTLFATYVSFTAIGGIRTFRESSRPLFSDVLAVRDYFRSAPPCAVLLRPRGLSGNEVDSEGYGTSPTRQTDRVHDFTLVALFRDHPVLDSWSGEPIADQQELSPGELPVCLAFDMSGSPLDTIAISTKYHELFRTEHWVVADSGLSLEQLQNQGIDAFYQGLFDLSAP